MRNIIVFDSQTSERKEYNDITALTFGELKNAIGQNFDNKKVVVKETRVTLENNDASLPDGDITLYLFQKQSKHGSDDCESVARSVRKLRKLVKEIHNMVVIGNSTISAKEETVKVEEEVVSEIDTMASEAEEIRKSLGL